MTYSSFADDLNLGKHVRSAWNSIVPQNDVTLITTKAGEKCSSLQHPEDLPPRSSQQNQALNPSCVRGFGALPGSVLKTKKHPKPGVALR
ncbi:hypothetical protein CRM22_000537 [Opisthorchis felineus]|uniref:Uncharacterized protein n=1 Tax=Opisthorchis felineus TaxID=147828 RepID=A0A4S2MEW2_OPIFE|nr:hypothetical protein CRM22_000537 [Opisthorchis felineus]